MNMLRFIVCLKKKKKFLNNFLSMNSFFVLIILTAVSTGSPVRTFCRFSFNGIFLIDGPSNSWTNDFYLSCFYPRNDLELYDIDCYNGTLAPSCSYYPALELINSNGQETTNGGLSPMLLSQQLVEMTRNDTYYQLGRPGELNLSSLDADKGWIGWVVRYRSKEIDLFDLRSFPFDSQRTSILLESSLYDITQLVFMNYSTISVNLFPPGSLDLIGLGWTFLSANISTGVHYYKAYDYTYSQIVVSVMLSRIPDYYIFKFVLGIMLLTIMSFFTFFIDAEDTQGRLGSALTICLAVIAFEFVAAQSLPILPYQTRFDKFVFLSFSILFCGTIFHAVNYYIRSVEEKRSSHSKSKRWALWKLNLSRKIEDFYQKNSGPLPLDLLDDDNSPPDGSLAAIIDAATQPVSNSSAHFHNATVATHPSSENASHSGFIPPGSAKGRCCERLCFKKARVWRWTDIVMCSLLVCVYAIMCPYLLLAS